MLKKGILNGKWTRGTDTTVLTEEERSNNQWGAIMLESRDQMMVAVQGKSS